MTLWRSSRLTSIRPKRKPWFGFCGRRSHVQFACLLIRLSLTETWPSITMSCTKESCGGTYITAMSYPITGTRRVWRCGRTCEPLSTLCFFKRRADGPRMRCLRHCPLLGCISYGLLRECRDSGVEFDEEWASSVSAIQGASIVRMSGAQTPSVDVSWDCAEPID